MGEDFLQFLDGLHIVRAFVENEGLLSPRIIEPNRESFTISHLHS